MLASPQHNYIFASLMVGPNAPASRREFLSLAAAPVAGAALGAQGLACVSRAVNAAGRRTPESLAGDEDFWWNVQNAFSIDRSLINFNNGGTCPAPAVVIDAQKRHIDFSNHLPTRQMWHVLGPEIETVRERVARDLNCSLEEIALTRNATESLEICQFGLDLVKGDEVIITSHDYPNMMNAWKQREKREGIIIKTLPYDPPASHDSLYEMIAAAVTPRTRVIHISHITFTTGQIFPVRRICDLARSRNVESIVDGAHAYGQFTFSIPDLQCDYYGVSLHKWILAPIGAGMLYVKKDKINKLWPLFGNAEPRCGDIRKFETYGTHPYAPILAVSEALTFHQTIGSARKSARLRWLRERWVSRLRGHKNVVFYTADDPATSAAIGTVGFRGGARGEMLDPGRVAEHLFNKHRIVTTPIVVPNVSGIRITPNVYTTAEEIELLAEALQFVADRGIPN